MQRLSLYVGWSCSFFALLGVMVFAVGCNDSQKQPVNVEGGPPEVEETHHDAGPHGGHIIELGQKHEYHAELVEDEGNKSVTVYILDGEMKELPIEESSLTLNLTVDGEAKVFELSAANASDGKASRFDAADASLFEALHDHGASGKLRVSINGSPYSGVVEHHHHEGDHDHHEGENHD